MKLVKVQKKLKEMNVDFDYKEDYKRATITFKNTKGKEYEIEYATDGNSLSASGSGLHSASTQQDVVNVLEATSYLFGCDDAKLAEMEIQAERSKLIREAVSTHERREYPVDDTYLLIVEVNGFGNKRFYVRGERGREGVKKYLQDIFVDSDRLFNEESKPTAKLNTSSFGRLENDEEVKYYVEAISLSVKALHEINKLIDEELSTEKVISFDEWLEKKKLSEA